MNVQIAKTVALVVVLLGLIGGLLLAIRWQADTTTIVGLAAAVGTGAAAAFRWLTGDKSPPGGPVAVLALVGASLGINGCAPAALAERAVTVQAEKTYKDEQSECVHKHETREEILACREKVRAEWGVDGGAQ